MRRGIVLASAPGALEELAEFRQRASGEWDVLAVNQSGIRYTEPLAAWGSVHADQIVGWIDQRRNLGYDMEFDAFGESFLPGQDRASVRYIGPVRWACGSSALYVVQYALEQGYSQIVLAGVHLSGRYEMYRDGWREAFDVICGKVYSLSGWTRDFLGPPPEDWYKD